MGGATAVSTFPALDPPPPLSRMEALAEAHRCLMCWDAPCTRACPTSIDVPGFIKRIGTGDDAGSARTILTANILGSSCARVCPTEVLCEGACVLNDLHRRPIEIGRLQAYAADPVVLGGHQIFTRQSESGHRVAVVGGGPAGLACAAELAKLGHGVVVFDANEDPGGLNTHGVADYKLPRPTSLAEVEWIRGLGVEIRSGQRVEDLATLLEEYEAVFTGVGLGAIQPLGIPGEDLPGSEDALEFIKDIKGRPRHEMSLEGQRVAVIGGGNTAIDASTQSARLGADKVYVVYRRGREQMRAYDHEIDLALADGVEFVFWAAPVSIEGSDAAAGLVCRKTELIDGTPTPIDESEFTLDVTRVFRATGQEKQRSFFDGSGIELDDGGRVAVDAEFRTNRPKVWSGGDCVNGGQEVVNAVAHGRDAARSIDRALRGEDS